MRFIAVPILQSFLFIILIIGLQSCGDECIQGESTTYRDWSYGVRIDLLENDTINVGTSLTFIFGYAEPIFIETFLVNA